MKKYLSLTIAFLLVFLCSCKGNEPPVHKTADMLSITNEEKSFLGCKSRLDAVISAMSSKISTLENAHNAVIKAENSENFFLDENYILTSFEPFVNSSLSITEGFTEDMTNEKAQDFYKLHSEGLDIIYNGADENHELMFVSESLVKTYTAEYDKKSDSLRYTFSVEENGTEAVEEFLEFIRVGNSTYIIQSQSERCYIEFDEKGGIICFCCAKLGSGEFSIDESVYPETQADTDSFWVLSEGKPSYSGIHTFENGILTHEDCSSGPWKTIKINADDYASAFYGQ
ncbi:MAG: hypothetical protein IJD49_10015 [Clostridia bacterium]|nr:hypothetical protein [Clostridia bacterium]